MQLYPLLATWPAGEKLVWSKLLFYTQGKRSLSLKSFVFFLPLTCFHLIKVCESLQVKNGNEKKKVTSLCTSLTTEKQWRIVQPFLHAKTFLSKKTQNHPSLYPAWNWNNAQEVTMFTLSSGAGSFLGFYEFLMLQNSSYSPRAELATPGEPGPHCSDPAGSSTTLKTIYEWRVQRIKKPNKTSQGVPSQKLL